MVRCRSFQGADLGWPVDYTTSKFASEVHVQVIVTSYLFPDAKFSLGRLRKISSAVGKGRLVVDVRCVVW